MINAVIVFGKPGAGKTDAVGHLKNLIEGGGLRIAHLSDRLLLEEAVIRDTRESKIKADGSRRGAHSILLADGQPGQRRVHVLDGVLLNRIHEEMVDQIAKKGQNGDVIVAEYAIGPTIDFGPTKEPLHQSASDLVELLVGHSVANRTFLFDIEAPVAVREGRQSLRPDALALETFQAYFPDGGEISRVDRDRLRERYVRLRNEGSDRNAFLSYVGYIYEAYIRPHLTPEGASVPVEGGRRQVER